METKTRAILAVVAVAAIAGVTLVAGDSKEPAPVEGKYLRVRKCRPVSEKKTSTLPALAAEAWAVGTKPAQTVCEWLTVLEQDGKSIVVSREPALDMGAKTEIYAKGDALGFECACSKGSGCDEFKHYLPDEKRESEWVAAPPGKTLAKGHWRGVGCFPKPCVELSLGGVTSTPSECPTK
jgi:hypothetical protein